MISFDAVDFSERRSRGGKFLLTLHYKNTRVSMTRKRVRWGQTPFRVNYDPEISQLDAKYDPELVQSDPHYLSIWLIAGSPLTRNGVWPQRTLFRVTADPGVLECGCIYTWSPLDQSLRVNNPIFCLTLHAMISLFIVHVSHFNVLTDSVGAQHKHVKHYRFASKLQLPCMTVKNERLLLIKSTISHLFIILPPRIFKIHFQIVWLVVSS